MSDSKKLTAVLKDIIFAPTDDMRQAKEIFWAKYSENPLGSSRITKATALQITGIPSLGRWWGLDGFSDWFSNKDEFKQRLQYLAQKALDCLEETLTNPEANASARVNAAKLVIEAANKMPNRHAKQVYIDADVQSMDKKELEQFIARRVGNGGEE